VSPRPPAGRTEDRGSGLEARYAYRTPYVPDPEAFLERVRDRPVVPYQVEVQPGHLKGGKICWLECSYCYGGSSVDDGRRLSAERLLDVVRQTADGPHGRVGKIILAGYATDPLHYEGIEDLVEATLANGQVTGFNTKALRVSPRLVELLADPRAADTSYFNVSVDAGSSETYNRAHDVSSKADLYGKVLDNLRRIAEARDASGATRDLSASYLLTRVNWSEDEVQGFLADTERAGVDLVRFTFPQLPRHMAEEGDSIIPTRSEAREAYRRLAPLIEGASTDRRKTMILDVDSKFTVVPRRVLPCMARFVFPAVGFDGYLYPCSQSAAPQFRPLSLGDLAERDFWDAYYDYDVDAFWDSLDRAHREMERLDCRCDRKEQCVNGDFAALGRA